MAALQNAARKFPAAENPKKRVPPAGGNSIADFGELVKPFPGETFRNSPKNFRFSGPSGRTETARPARGIRQGVRFRKGGGRAGQNRELGDSLAGQDGLRGLAVVM